MEATERARQSIAYNGTYEVRSLVKEALNSPPPSLGEADVIIDSIKSAAYASPRTDYTSLANLTYAKAITKPTEYA